MRLIHCQQDSRNRYAVHHDHGVATIDPFTIIFDNFMVYIPTTVFVGDQILLRLRPQAPTRE